MSGPAWSPTDLTRLRTFAGDRTHISLAEWTRFGATCTPPRSGNSCRCRWDDERAGPLPPKPESPPIPPTPSFSPFVVTHPPVTVTASPVPRVSPVEMWERAEVQTTADVARHQTERVLRVTVEDTRPIGISFISDQHIRQSGPIQMAAMRQDAELVARTPGLFCCLGGDGVDNHIKHRSAMVGGGSKVAEEWRLYDHYLGMFGEKPLAVISGNHDDWTRDEAGVDMVSVLAHRNQLHYAPDEIRLDVNLSGQSYRIALRHQYRYNSLFNLLHAVKRWWEMGDDPFDIGVICHHHEPAMEPFTKHGRTVWGFRPGSYQVNSSHGRRYGFNNTTPTCPTVILFPDTHQVLGFADVWQAANYLTWLRGSWPHGYRRRSLEVQ